MLGYRELSYEYTDRCSSTDHTHAPNLSLYREFLPISIIPDADSMHHGSHIKLEDAVRYMQDKNWLTILRQGLPEAN